MNESRYGQVFSDAADSVMISIGADESYIAGGNSYFTVDTHISYLDECMAGDEIEVRSSVIFADGKKLKLAHTMNHVDGRTLSKAEQLLVHVDLQTRKSCLPNDEMLRKIEILAAQYSAAD